MTPLTSTPRPLLLCLAALALSGCALLGRSPPSSPRYYTPEYLGGQSSLPLHPELQLRLGRIEGWSHLRERLARSSSREFFYDEGRRWSELPETYLRRALTRALFEQRGLTEAVSGPAVTLEVELVAFEEVDRPRRARLEAVLTLRDDQLVLLAETIAVEKPIEVGPGGDAAPAIVGALSDALREGVERIAERAVEKLGERLSDPKAGGRKSILPLREAPARPPIVLTLLPAARR